jgi:hypothetical protein
VEGVEIGNAIYAKNDRLAINGELLSSDFQGSFHDPRMALGPIVAVAGKQPDPIAVAVGNMIPGPRGFSFLRSRAPRARNTQSQHHAKSKIWNSSLADTWVDFFKTAFAVDRAAA